MTELRYSTKADAIGFLYRAAYLLATGEISQGLQMLEKAKPILMNQNSDLLRLLEVGASQLITEEKKKYWAERVLDLYTSQIQKYAISQ